MDWGGLIGRRTYRSGGDDLRRSADTVGENAAERRGDSSPVSPGGDRSGDRTGSGKQKTAGARFTGIDIKSNINMAVCNPFQKLQAH